MVIVSIEDQERFDRAIASLTCGYCNKSYPTKEQMLHPSEVYSDRGRIKRWVPTCKDCAKSPNVNSNIGEFSTIADLAATPDKIMTAHDRDEIWAALENATINLTSFGESFVPLVDVLKAACKSNAKAYSMYQVHDWDQPKDVEKDNKAVWPLIHEIIAMSDSGKYPTFKIDESTRDGPVLYITFRRSPNTEY
ncbi:MAG: hypothetical protein M3258_00455 [Thermoproteota archaeon]|jgi:hypothetical protein|nr:hypothetical protein [Thermoproteota archaeon]